ncbi:SDR family NAD(P)-dependent oxidoreductase [Flammeovirgaceae bacterium SG7u.111]|nr:SDR family NAD(P)-dependent oxidoreductase [Flammeovirgaceae bacterium SG7u.132]WPO38806.1 SDR family NAD(P)-dependent oxidoreductase [Flammeovirgaceae bacterium SG7u.111]
MMAKIALVTGATSGIGEATARIFAENGIDLIICGRREDRLKKLAEEFGEKVNVMYLAFDVKNKEKVLEAIESIPESMSKIDILVNNAGNAHGLDSIQNGDLDDWDAMIDINVKGLLYVSKAVMPGMVDRKSGHIINIGSIAGKEVYPNGNVYCASKHAVDAINKGMLLDLNPYGIKVTAINPGLVNTEFSEVRFKGDESKAENVYKGMDPLLGEDIAELIYFAVSRPAHVNISDLTVLPTAQASATVVNRDV